jgi:RNase adaptor protein for sRNA GlmZ degradation
MVEWYTYRTKRLQKNERKKCFLQPLTNTAEMLLQVTDMKTLEIEDKIKSTFPELERLSYNMLC